MSEELYVLQDSRNLLGNNLLFWRKGGGYTQHLVEADTMTKTQAFYQHECRSSDIPWKLDELLRLSKLTVDSDTVARYTNA